MKQPALGRKIFDLRIEKGLTQEELVGKCNVSVRTIQRIENGEVSPRSYTVKSIFAALDYDSTKRTDEDSNFIEAFISWFKHFILIDINTDQPSNFIVKQLNIAWMFGLLYFSTGIFESASEYFLLTADKLIFNKGIFIAIKVVALISFVFFQRGFVLIGGIFGNYLLKIISSIMIFAIIPLYFYDIILLYNDSVDRIFIAIASALTFGFIGVIFGISLIKLEGQIGKISKYAGFLEILGGCFLLTIVLAFVGLVIYIPAELFEIILIFKVIEIIKKKQANDITPCY